MWLFSDTFGTARRPPLATPDFVPHRRAPPAKTLQHAWEAVAEAHALGIVHSDLKPRNLFIAETPRDTPILGLLAFRCARPSLGEEDAM